VSVTTSVYDLPAGVVLHSLTFEGNFFVTGGTITLDGDISVDQVGRADVVDD
jgi:hypothetical protein